MPYRRKTTSKKFKSKTARRSRTARKVSFAAAPRRQAVALIKKVVKGEAETKMVAFYGGNGSGDTRGTLAAAGAVGQNQFISVNSTDILQIIPPVSQGTNDTNRIGQSITPVSMKIHCKVDLTPQNGNATGYQAGTLYDLTAVAYCLQHVSYKTYASLYAQNLFTQLLDTGEGTTVNFEGSFEASHLPVAKGYYKVLARTKKMYLRSPGIIPGPAASPNITNLPQMNSSAPHTHEWTWDITKMLPKKLQYPENDTTVAGQVDLPLNAAPFWCIAYYNTDTSAAFPTSPAVRIRQQYVSMLRFKDM